MFRGSWNSNKGLKDGIIGAIIRQNVYFISAKKIEFENVIFLKKMTFLNFQGYENHKRLFNRFSDFFDDDIDLIDINHTLILQN